VLYFFQKEKLFKIPAVRVGILIIVEPTTFLWELGTS
jgi:hypothetical protein